MKGQWSHIYSRQIRSAERESRVYRTKILLSKGLEPAQIAVILGVSSNTVKTYMKECDHITLSDAKDHFITICKKCNAKNDMFNGYYEKCKKCGHYLNSNCFIATAVYNDPFSPEVRSLRKWRDKTLLKSSYGKVFVKYYYLISPSIAKILYKSGTLKLITKFVLNQIVKMVKTHHR